MWSELLRLRNGRKNGEIQFLSPSFNPWELSGILLPLAFFYWLKFILTRIIQQVKKFVLKKIWGELRKPLMTIICLSLPHLTCDYLLLPSINWRCQSSSENINFHHLLHNSMFCCRKISIKRSFKMLLCMPK